MVWKNGGFESKTMFQTVKSKTEKFSIDNILNWDETTVHYPSKIKEMFINSAKNLNGNFFE